MPDSGRSCLPCSRCRDGAQSVSLPLRSNLSLSSSSPGKPSDGPLEERLNGEPHLTERKEEESDVCVVCTANKLWEEIIYYCKTCIKEAIFVSR